MPFHCQTKPPIVMKTSSGDFKLVRKGTTYENLFEEEGDSFINLSHNLYLISMLSFFT